MQSKIILLLLVLTASAFGNHRVYLIHGFGSSPIFMTSINSMLNSNGMKTENYGYNSFKEDITVLGNRLYLDIKEKHYDTVSFVTHSMGALILRVAIDLFDKDPHCPVIGRIVMVAPPNHGAEIADFFASSKIWRFILGPNIQNLATDSTSLANKLPVPKGREIGIIIGMRNGKKGYNPFIHGNNDGYLTPDRAKLGTETEDVYVSAEHSLIIHNKKTLQLILRFLQTGSFQSGKRD